MIKGFAMKYVIRIMLSGLIGFIGCSRCETAINGKAKLPEEAIEISTAYKSELSSRLGIVSGLIRTSPKAAISTCTELREWICSRKNRHEREYGVEQLEKAILSTETRTLPNADRERAVSVMFELEMTDVLKGLNSFGASHTRRWRSRFKFLRRVQDEIEQAKADSAEKEISERDRRRLLHLVQFVDANYQMWLKWMERDFVMNWVDKIGPSEYEQIRKDFEEFLGRPLKNKDDFR